MCVFFFFFPALFLWCSRSITYISQTSKPCFNRCMIFLQTWKAEESKEPFRIERIQEVESAWMSCWKLGSMVRFKNNWYQSVLFFWGESILSQKSFGIWRDGRPQKERNIFSTKNRMGKLAVSFRIVSGRVYTLVNFSFSHWFIDGWELVCLIVGWIFKAIDLGKLRRDQTAHLGISK